MNYKWQIYFAIVSGYFHLAKSDIEPLSGRYKQVINLMTSTAHIVRCLHTYYMNLTSLRKKSDSAINNLQIMKMFSQMSSRLIQSRGTGSPRARSFPRFTPTWSLPVRREAWPEFGVCCERAPWSGTGRARCPRTTTPLPFTRQPRMGMLMSSKCSFFTNWTSTDR